MTLDIAAIEAWLQQHVSLTQIDTVLKEAEDISGLVPSIPLLKPVLGILDEAVVHIEHYQSQGKDHETATQIVGALFLSIGSKFFGIGPSPIPPVTP